MTAWIFAAALIAHPSQVAPAEQFFSIKNPVTTAEEGWKVLLAADNPIEFRYEGKEATTECDEAMNQIQRLCALSEDEIEKIYEFHFNEREFEKAKPTNDKLLILNRMYYRMEDWTNSDNLQSHFVDEGTTNWLHPLIILEENNRLEFMLMPRNSVKRSVTMTTGFYWYDAANERKEALKFVKRRTNFKVQD